jgi:hypothetical protein
VTPDGNAVQEFHSVAFTDGCWSGNVQVLPKYTWRHSAPLPQSQACSQEVPTVDEILCKPHVPVGTYDCTPKYRGQPILPEGDPQRRACELKAMGGADPTYSLEPTGNSALSLAQLPNPIRCGSVARDGRAALHGAQ